MRQSANVRPRRQRSFTEKLIVPAVLGIIVLVFGYMFFTSINIAIKESSFVMKSLQSQGGKVVCQESNSGRGYFNNKQPWHDTTYILPEKANNIAELIELVRSKGFNLVTTEQYKKDSGRSHAWYGIPVTTPADVDRHLVNDKGSQFYISDNNGSVMRLDVYRTSQVSVICQQYRSSGFKVAVPEGHVAVRLWVVVPE